MEWRIAIPFFNVNSTIHFALQNAERRGRRSVHGLFFLFLTYTIYFMLCTERRPRRSAMR
jgi:hypothetical protein